MDIKEKMELLAEAMDVDQDEINPNMKLSELDCWDSMTKLSIIVMLDDEFNKKITSKDLIDFQTVNDILNAME